VITFACVSGHRPRNLALNHPKPSQIDEEIREAELAASGSWLNTIVLRQRLAARLRRRPQMNRCCHCGAPCAPHGQPKPPSIAAPMGPRRRPGFEGVPRRFCRLRKGEADDHAGLFLTLLNSNDGDDFADEHPAAVDAIIAQLQAADVSLRSLAEAKEGGAL
jgi:hypothetical protein